MSLLDVSPPRVRGLEFLWLEITQHCNLQCQHCYTESSPRRPHPARSWLPVIDDAYDAGCRRVQFIGGEPLSHRDLPRYIAHASGRGYTFIEVYSNLSLLTPAMLDVLERHGVNVATSFYSARAEVHDGVTGVPGSFRKTVAAISSVLSRGLPLRIGLVTDEPDSADTANAISLLTGLGVDRETIRFDHTRPVGRGATVAEPQSLAETLCGHCWEGKLAVSYDGNCYPCVFSRGVVVGNVDERPLLEIVGGRELETFRTWQSGLWNQGDGDPTDPKAKPACSPDCGPAGPCPPNCSPACTPPCNPDHCNPVGGI